MATPATAPTISVSGWPSIRIAGSWDCAFSVVQAGGAPALLLRLAPCPARAHGHAVGPLPPAGDLADAPSPGGAGGQRQRRLLRPDLLGPVPRRSRKPARPCGRAARRVMDRHPLRPVRPLERRGASSGRGDPGRRSNLPRDQDRSWGCAQSRCARVGGAPATSTERVLPLGAAGVGRPHLPRIFFDGPRGEALVMGRLVATTSIRRKAAVPGVEDGKDLRMATARQRVKLHSRHAAWRGPPRST